MHHEFTIYPELSLIVRTWTGDVSLEFLISALAELESHPDFDQSFDIIGDFRNARVTLSLPEIQRFVKDLKTRDPTQFGRWALVASEDLEFGRGRQWQALWGRENAAIFRSIEDARAWLGKDPS